MSEEQMERLITQIIQRLRPPLLVMVTAADGYRRAIRNRLAASGQTLHLALDEGIADLTEWQGIGNVLAHDAWQDALPPRPYRALVLPFLDYSLAAELVNGTLRGTVARRLHDALLTGLPVLALRYHCDPASELNQLHGALPDSAYAGQMQATLARLAECGVTLCTMNELLEKLTSDREIATTPSEPSRYLTVTDVANNPALAASPGVKLTDAASDFLRNRKI